MKGRSKQVELFISRINYRLKDKGAFFVIGKNFIWIELHLIDILKANIEVGIGDNYVSSKEVEIFNPFYYKKNEERKRRLMPLGLRLGALKGDQEADLNL